MANPAVDTFLGFTPDQLTAFGIGLMFVLGGVGQYLLRFRKQPVTPTDPVLTGVGLGLSGRSDMRMLIDAVIRVGDILENKKQAAIEDRLEDLMDELRRKEHR